MKENKKTQITKNETLSKINEKFLELNKINKLALMPFIMARVLPHLEYGYKIVLILGLN